MNSPDQRLMRLESAWSRLTGEGLAPTHLIANDDVLIERAAVDQLTQVAALPAQLRALGIGSDIADIERVVATPDLHPGSPFPVGVAIEAHGLVIPGAVGADIGCGMRLMTFDVTEAEIEGHIDALSHHLRSLFFEGARDIPLSPRQRAAILVEGLHGLASTFDDNAGSGIWRGLDAAQIERDMTLHHEDGSLIAQRVHSVHDTWVRSSGSVHGRDDQIGSLGGGNHMAELQVIDEVVDAFTARTFGLDAGQLCVLIHSGSLVLGSAVAHAYRERAGKILREMSPAKAGQIPGHLTPLIEVGEHAHVAGQYIDALRTAANFATVNRLALSLMFAQAMSRTLGREVHASLVWDAPHNLTWGNSDKIVHRKGATPAHGPTGTGRFGVTGEPVLLPGSMGDASWVLAGSGSERALESASHGAGRAVARGKAAHAGKGRECSEIDEKGLNVVTSVDFKALAARGRHDIAEQMQARLAEEAPSAYKSVEPALRSLEQAGVARRVARLRPLLTVKDA